MTAARQQPPEFGPDTALPALRSELVVTEAGVDASGASGVTLHDPLRHKFFRFSASAGRMLANWHLGLAGTVATASDTTLDELQEFLSFLASSRLTVSVAGGVQALNGEYQQGEKSIGESALHNYLFFRVPLFNPTRFLDAGLPTARLLASKPVLWCLAVIGLVGFYFAARQWDKFAASFADFFSLEGLALYSATLVVLKIFHELGHGFMARHFKCNVPVIGVAFMVMAPMLYTETTDAWRLKDKRERMLIGAAGVMVEMAIAAVALFAWAFLPDGPWRSVMYFISATAWTTSVLVNFSPFMRFDGYHILADALAMHNLGPRAFSLATWQLRQFLFGTREPAPEQLSPGLRQTLVGFAVGTWLYRLSLYLGIAYTVYVMFPKAIGIPLALVEVVFFIAMPVWRELKDWKAMGLRQLFETPRSRISLSLAAAVIFLTVLPISRSVNIPAVLLPARETWFYAPEPSQVVDVRVKSGDSVVQGQTLIRLFSPDLEQKAKSAELRFALNTAKLAAIAGDQKNLSQSAVLEKERNALLDEINGLRARKEALSLRATFPGLVTDLDTGLWHGVWVGRRNALLHVVADEGALLVGQVSDREVNRLLQGGAASFIPENGIGSAIPAVMVSVGAPGGEGMEFVYLSSENGGPVPAARTSARGPAKSLSGFLPVSFQAELAPPAKAQRGTLTADAKPRSLMALAFARLVSVFLRESGF